MPEKFDPAAYDPAKVPEGWTPPEDRGEADTIASAPRKGRKAWWVCLLLALVLIERLLKTTGFHI